MAKRLKFLGIAAAVAAIGLLVASCDTGQQAQQQTAQQVLITVTGIPEGWNSGNIRLYPVAGEGTVAVSGTFNQANPNMTSSCLISTNRTLGLAMRVPGGNQPFSTSGTYMVSLTLSGGGNFSTFVIPSRSINAGSNTIPWGDFPQP